MNAFHNFPKNGLNFVTQEFTKSWKMLLSNAHNIRFCYKTIFKKVCYAHILIWIVLNTLLNFLKKWFQLRDSKTCKKLKNAFFKWAKHWFLSSRLLQNQFIRRFLFPTVSTPSLKSLQKTEKCFFSNAQNIRFWGQGCSKSIFLEVCYAEILI